MTLNKPAICLILLALLPAAASATPSHIRLVARDAGTTPILWRQPTSPSVTLKYFGATISDTTFCVMLFQDDAGFVRQCLLANRKGELNEKEAVRFILAFFKRPVETVTIPRYWAVPDTLEWFYPR